MKKIKKLQIISITENVVELKKVDKTDSITLNELYGNKLGHLIKITLINDGKIMGSIVKPQAKFVINDILKLTTVKLPKLGYGRGRVLNHLGDDVTPSRSNDFINMKDETSSKIEYFEEEVPNYTYTEDMKDIKLLHTGIKIIDFIGLKLGDFHTIQGIAGSGKSVVIEEIINSVDNNADLQTSSKIIYGGIGERDREIISLYNSQRDEGLHANKIFIAAPMGQAPAAARTLALDTVLEYADRTTQIGQNPIVVVDNAYRYIQAKNEEDSQVGVKLVKGFSVETGRHVNELVSHFGSQKIEDGKIVYSTGIFTNLATSEEYIDEGVREINQQTSSKIVLRPDISGYPKVSFTDSHSGVMKEGLINERHLKLYNKVKKFYGKYEDNKDIISSHLMNGSDLKNPSEDLSYALKGVKRVDILNAYWTQPLRSAHKYTNKEPLSVSYDDLLDDIESILSGAFDKVENIDTFKYRGSIR